MDLIDNKILVILCVVLFLLFIYMYYKQTKCTSERFAPVSKLSTCLNCRDGKGKTIDNKPCFCQTKK